MTERNLSSPGRRVAFTATLAAAMGVGPFAVLAVSALAPLLVPELGLSRTQLGSVATLNFALAATASLLAGRRVDLYRGRTVLFWVFSGGALAATAMALAQSLVWLWIGAMIAGFSLGTANLVTNQLIADHVPPGRRGVQVGMKQSGTSLSLALAGFALPPLSLLIGWRGAILFGVLIAAASIVAAVLVIPYAEAPRKRGTAGSTSRLSATVWWLGAYASIVGILSQAVVVYVPLYAFENVGLTAAVAGTASGLLGGLGACARVVWSRVADRPGAPAHVLIAMAAISLLGVAGIAGGEYLGPWLLWTGLVAFGASAMGANAVLMLAVVSEAKTGRVGQDSGAVGLGLFLGFMLGPVGFGALVDITDSYTVGWAVVAGLCVVSLVIAIGWQRRTGRPGRTPQATDDRPREPHD